MEYDLDGKWRQSKDDTKNHSSSKSSSLLRSVSQKNTSSNKSSSFLRSFSTKNSCQKSSTSSSSSPSRNSSEKRANFTRKCKEQKAKFYIVKRCIGMLVNWNKNGDS